MAQPGFERKLEAFVGNPQRDRLFIVPAANLHQHLKQYCREHGVQVLTLDAFAGAGASGSTKAVLTVAGDELPLLVTTLFAMPQKHMECLDRSSHLPGVGGHVLGREVPLTNPGDIHRLHREASAERPPRQLPGRERVVGPMPGAVVQHFQGRGRELGLIRWHLADEHIRLVWVCGRGGIGKTSLVTKLLHELQGVNGMRPHDTPPGRSRASST